jgi:hypothetical protein
VDAFVSEKGEGVWTRGARNAVKVWACTLASVKKPPSPWAKGPKLVSSCSGCPQHQHLKKDTQERCCSVQDDERLQCDELVAEIEQRVTQLENVLTRYRCAAKRI